MELKCSDDLKKLFLDFAYPIGSCFVTRINNDPNKLFGGSWTKLSGGFIYACKDTADDHITNTTGAITGSTVLTEKQIPNHTHIGIFDNTNGHERVQSYGTGDIHTGFINGMGQTPWNEHYRTGYTGGGQGHTHDMPRTGIFIWYRTA